MSTPTAYVVLGAIGGYGVVGWSLVCIEGGFGHEINVSFSKALIFFHVYIRIQGCATSKPKKNPENLQMD